MATSEIGGQALKRLLRAGVKNVAAHEAIINRLNVFPVPDGDTGVNMRHTLERANREIEPISSDDASLISQQFAHGALMGARGNSGVIMSQFLQGFADGMRSAPTLSAEGFADACESAVRRGYAAVSEPSEGTILTVAREASEQLLGAPRPDSLTEMLETLIDAARASLARTPTLLPILKDAGVVDAGGMGLVCFLEGARGRGRAVDAESGAFAGAPILNDSAEAYGYDVQFLMLGEHLDVAAARRDLERMGDSVIVVSDRGAIKVHLHVDNPAIPLDYAIQSGAALADIVVENMELQVKQRLAGAPAIDELAQDDSAEVAVIAVVDGDGFHEMYREMGCGAIINGGPGCNPSIEALVAAIEQQASARVIILPNNRDTLLAAKQAARIVAHKRAEVVATATAPQGISAMVAYCDAIDSKATFAAMLARMREASDSVSAIEIARALRASRICGIAIEEDDYIAIVDGRICAAAPDAQSVALGAVDTLGARESALATLYYGAEVPAGAADRLAQGLSKALEGIEFETVYGGQSRFPFLIGLES